MKKEALNRLLQD